MDLSRILELAETASEIIKDIREKTNGYIKKINNCITEIQTLINNAVRHSIEFVKTKLEFICNKIYSALEGFTKWFDKTVKDIKEWYDDKMNAIKFAILKGVNSKLGLCLPNALLEAAAKAIPHPELPIPEFKIELPEELNIEFGENFGINQYVEIPLIPTI